MSRYESRKKISADRVWKDANAIAARLRAKEAARPPAAPAPVVLKEPKK